MGFIKLEVNPDNLEEKKWLEALINKVITLIENKNNLSGLTLSIAFVSQDEIKRLNKNYRGIDKATDVLSFSYLESDMEVTEDNLLGEIIISKDYIREQADDLGIEYKEELVRMILHGFLHILGYTHAEDEDSRQMTDLTEGYLKKTRDIWMHS